MKKFSISAFIFLFLFSACLRDIDDVVITEDTPNPDLLENYDPVIKNVNASIMGFVVDENETPVIGATVKLGSTTTTTDDFGHFFFENETMNARGTIVQVAMDGYFDGSRRFFPMAASENRVKIELIPKIFDKTFESSTGGSILIDGGGTLIFGESSIRDASGSPYSGEVLVATKWLDPSDLRVLNQMPGNLQGVDVTNEEVAIGSYGMMAVELESPSGESLNLIDGETATITMPIPSSMLGNAPSEIPLWSYSEAHGIWVEESTATLIGSNYVGQVGHFSFWNCDYPYPLVEFEATFQDNTGVPLIDYAVGITVNGSWTCYSYTDENGSVGGLIPAGEVLILSVYNICGQPIYTEEIGPYTSDVTLGPITVTGTEVNTTVVTGQLLDCDLNPIENGVIVATYNGQSTYFYLESSEFEIPITVCVDSGGTEVTLVAYDYNSLVQSEAITVIANQATDVGDIIVCESVVEDYVLIVIGTQTGLYTENLIVSTDSLGTYTNIQAYGNNPGGSEDFIYFGFEGGTTGDYSGANYYEVIFNMNLGWQYQGGSFTSFNVTNYGDAPGGIVSGSFSGIIEQQGVTEPVSGEFRITR